MCEHVLKYTNTNDPIERIKIYNQFSEDYEPPVKLASYTGYKVCAEVVAKHTSIDNRGEMKVMDIASGTGLVAKELVKCGFKTIDALDPSSGINEIVRQKNLYRNIYTEFLTAKPLQCIPADTYYVVTVVGAYQHGHMPYDAVHEMIRLTKPGGIICIVSRKEAFYEYKEYKDSFLPLCSDLEKQNKWQRVEFEFFDEYHPTLTGTTIVYRVL